jgi:NADPH:quinone reductase
MQALTTTGSGRFELGLGEVPEPRPRANEALVAVHATSLNAGEVRRIPVEEAGTVLGWDLAGEVIEPAADGSGPVAGTRVVGLVQAGAWAQRCAVPTHALACLPDPVPYAAAATLPVAGLTAFRALEQGGLLLGQHVLVTGAAGGVGRFAVELAHASGAAVTAVVGRPERGAGLRELGAGEVVVGHAAAAGPYDLVLESVGGDSLAHALQVCAEGGTVVSYGRSSHDDVTFAPTWFLSHSGSRLIGLLIFTEVQARRSGAEQLARLAGLVADDRLHPHVDREAPWTEAEQLAQALTDRRIAGKAVLHVQ